MGVVVDYQQMLLYSLTNNKFKDRCLQLKRHNLCKQTVLEIFKITTFKKPPF